MPIVSPATRHTVNRDPITDAHVILLEFREDGASRVERAAINNEDVVFEGNVFTAAPGLQVHVPSTSDQDAASSVSASNVDRVLGRALDACRQRISVRMILVDMGDPSQAIIDTRNLMVIPSASGDTETISATLGPRADMQEPVPFRRTTRQDFPGVFLA